MAAQHENLSVNHVLQGGVDGLGRKTQGQQEVGPPSNLIQGQMDRYNKLSSR